MKIIKRSTIAVRLLGWFLTIAVVPLSVLVYIAVAVPDAFFRRAIILSGAVTIGLVITLALVAARSISRPITKMTEAVTRISNGYLNQEVLVSTDDELGELSRAFNKMSADLKRVYDTIEESVR